MAEETQAASPADVALDRLLNGLFWFALAAMLAMNFGQFRWNPGFQGFQNAHIAFALILAFVVRVTPSRNRWLKIGVLVLLVGVAVSEFYLFNDRENFWKRIPFGSGPDLITGLFIFLLVLVASRIAFGWVLPILGIIFLIYHFTADFWPGFLDGQAFSVQEVLTRTVQFQHKGVVDQASRFLWLLIFWGIVLATAGASLIVTGMARYFSRRLVGGPAIGALVASGIAGSFVGAGPNNVAVTGPITIPAMVRGGYRADEAAGVEGVASNASAITPPILGVVAFVMSDLLGISYLEVIRMSLVPAAMWYLGTAAYIIGHAKSNPTRIRRVEMTEEERAELPRAEQELGVYAKMGAIIFLPMLLLLLNLTTIEIFPWRLFGDTGIEVFLSSAVMVLLGVVGSVLLAIVTRSQAGMYIRSAAIAVVPVSIIIALVLQGFTLRPAVIAAVMATVMLGVILRVERRWSAWSAGFKSAAFYASSVSLVLVIITIIADVVSHTDVGTRFGEIVREISGGSIAIAGAVLIVLSVIMAAGLPTLAIYFLVTVTFVPVLAELGVHVQTSHFVAFFMGTLSLIIPPVAGSALVGAAISGSTYGQVSWQLVRMAWPFYIFPILILLAPDDLLLLPGIQDNGIATALVLASTAIVLVGIQAASAGWLGARVNILMRVAFYGVGAVLFYGLLRDNATWVIIAPLATLALAGGLFLTDRMRGRPVAASTPTTGG